MPWRGAAAALMLGLAPAALAYPDGPPPAHTGGFGEAHCGECHFGGPRGGRLELDGLAGAWRPGQSYEFELRLAATGMAVGGFQLSVRFADGPRAGEPAGRLAAEGDGLKLAEIDGVSYLSHRAVVAADAAGDIGWRLRWTAPEQAAGAVLFTAAAVAADDDFSPLGDTVYRLRRRLPAE